MTTASNGLSRRPATRRRPGRPKTGHTPATKSPALERPAREAKPARAGNRRKAELAEELARELQSLRTTGKEVVESWSLRVNSLLAAAALRLTPRAGDAAPSLPAKGDLEKALAAVRAVKLKPRKGRLKDLVRIERAAETLAERFGGEG